MKRTALQSQDPGAPLIDDLIGIVAMASVDHRLMCERDWSSLFSLRTVSRLWSHIVSPSLISLNVHELNLHCVRDRCPYWATMTFPNLHTLVVHAEHPLCAQLPALTNLRSLAIDGWLPAITHMERLERLLVFDSRDDTPEGFFIVPPRRLSTLALADAFLTDGVEGMEGIIGALSLLTELRSLVLCVGADHIQNDRYEQEIRDRLPQLEKFRWHAFYFDPYEKILGPFFSREI